MDIPELPEGFTVAGNGAEAQMSAQKAQAEAAQEEQRRMILDQIMMPDARERLNNISIVKKEKAKALEDMLIAAAQKGQLPGKVTKDQFIQMLESVNSQLETRMTVTISRRKNFGDSDDDNDDDLM